MMNVRGKLRSAVTVALVAIITCGGFTGVATAAQGTPTSPVAASAEVTAKGFKRAVNETLQYVTTDREGNRHFDTAQALSAGASPEVFVIGAEVNRIAPALSGTGTLQGGKDGTASTQGLRVSFPVHGRWCGPGHGGGTPIDTLDTLCMRHDKCYAARGYFDCLCDKQLRDEIYRFRNRMGGVERAKAAAITVVFSSIPCRP